MDEKKELKDLIREVMQEEGSVEEKNVDAEPKVEATKSVEELVEKLGSSISESIAKALGESKPEKAAEEIKSELFSYDKGMKAIVYPTLDKIGDLSPEEKIVLFFKSLMMKHADSESEKVFKALVEGTDGDGGYLVPTPLATEVWRILPDLSVMRRIARTIPMTAETLKLNSLAAKPTAYWTTEYASKTTSSAEFSQVTLTARKLAVILPAADELIADANIDIVRFIIELFAEVFAEEEDRAFFIGNGTTQPRGINQETLSTIDAGGTFNFDDLIDLIDLVPQAVRGASSAAFCAHKKVIRQLRKVKDSNNNYIWQGITSPMTQRPVDTIMGYPIYEVNHLNQNRLYFGDWRYYIIGDRQQLTVDTTREGGDAWRRDSTEVRAVERVDGRAVLTSAFAYATGV
jgi:HK97 family phage major capsid protein